MTLSYKELQRRPGTGESGARMFRLQAGDGSAQMQY